MAIRSDAGLHGATPQMNRMPETAGQRPLFHSVRDIALILDKTLQGGYGVLKAGTILAENSVSGLLVPYITDDYDDTNVGRAFLVANQSNGTATCNVTIADSYKFQVADNLMLVYGDPGSPTPYHDGGAIISIDRTTYAAHAVITFTNVTTHANFTTANLANCYVKAGSATKYSTAKYILDKDVDTGSGEYTAAYGGNASVVMSNAILYVNNLTGYDSSALTDLGATADGRFLILK